MPRKKRRRRLTGADIQRMEARIARRKIQVACWSVYRNAIRTGKLIPQPCEVCGETKRIHGHHADYTKPLDVKWLCFRCHRREHGRFKDQPFKRQPVPIAILGTETPELAAAIAAYNSLL